MSIILSDASKKFGELTVFEGLNIKFNDSFTCIMGESGCGKTTLIRVLMGLESLDRGAVTGVPRRISAVFQEDRLSESFCAVVNVRIATGKNDREIYDCLEKLGLSESDAHKPVKELSGGMKRRVAIARALLYDADLYIFDEPFKGLDILTRDSVISFISRKLDGKTAIFITHSKEEAELLGAEIITLDKRGT